jgi:fructose-1,6-bisphosphatase/inositol monophosphatase family enzyme
MASPAHPKRQDWRDAAVAAADTAAQFITHEAMSRRTLAWEEKSATDFVSRVDVGAEERIRDLVADGLSLSEAREKQSYHLLQRASA